MGYAFRSFNSHGRAMFSLAHRAMAGHDEAEYVPIHRQRQRQEYRLVDATTGEFERGHVHVADMATRQPWDDTTPVHLNEPAPGRAMAPHRTYGDGAGGPG